MTIHIISFLHLILELPAHPIFVCPSLPHPDLPAYHILASTKPYLIATLTSPTTNCTIFALHAPSCAVKKSFISLISLAGHK
jgi:hypothetical protein